MDDAPILICYDGSVGAGNAITAAGALLGDRRAVVLNVGPLPVVAESYDALGSSVADLHDLIFEEALARAEAGAELARGAGFRADARAQVDSPTWRAVVEVADELGAAAIVLGSRGLTGVRELVEGSLAHQVATRGSRPVLVVPPTRRQAEAKIDVEQPEPSVRDVEESIRQALVRYAKSDSNPDLLVGTHKGSVTVAGTVTSWAEHDAVIAAAWAAPGVTNVNDNILVDY